MQPPLSPSAASGSTPVLRLQLEGITKRYPTVVANDGIDLAVRAGEIHALLGENGAGKSTLMKIIYGAVRPDAGVVRIDGQRVHIHNPQQARHLGIAMVFQHFSLFDSLTVAENVWLGLDREPGLAEVTRRIRETATRYGLEVDPLRPVHTLSVGEMQRVEIIRALLSNPRLLILDEPTSVLTPQAVEKLFVVLRQLASEGCSIVYISHKLHEIRALCSACTVVRGGRVTGVCDPRQESNASLSRWMIGAEPPALQHQAREPGEVVLRVQQLSLARTQAFGVDLQGIELQVRAGEVVGIAGVSGNGQKELLQALSGEDVRAPVHSVQLRSTQGAMVAAGGHEPGPAPGFGAAFCARRTPGARGCAQLAAGAQPAAYAHRCAGPAGLDSQQHAAGPGTGADRALWREGGRAAGASAVALGWQLAKIYRRARDRRPAAPAHRLAAYLGCGCGRSRAHPCGFAGAARCGLRRAGVQRGTGGAVRPERPLARAGQGPSVALGAARTGQHRAYRGMDERAVAAR